MNIFVEEKHFCKNYNDILYCVFQKTLLDGN